MQSRMIRVPRWHVNLSHIYVRRVVSVAVLELAALAGIGVAIVGGASVLGALGCLVFGLALVALVKRP